jgi:NAD(P)-dependent dehydrogenase (short-subunit alcohol dehydrogenase family)
MVEPAHERAVVLGARNLGGAIARSLAGAGASVAAIARTEADLAALATHGVVGIQADAADTQELRHALTRAEAAVGPPTLFVNAVSARRPGRESSGFGGGAVAAATIEDFEGWATAVAHQAFVFLNAAAAALAEREGTIVQITGAPARRAAAERGLVAAGMAGVRALTHASAQELKQRGVHVALLIVDGVIASPKTAQIAASLPAEALVHEVDVARAVHFLAAQTQHGLTHELVLTAAGDRWLP